MGVAVCVPSNAMELIACWILIDWDVNRLVHQTEDDDKRRRFPAFINYLFTHASLIACSLLSTTLPHLLPMYFVLSTFSFYGAIR